MDSLRQRKTFQFDDSEDSNEHILDETEQEELIQNLREENSRYDQYYLLILQFIVLASGALHLSYLFSTSSETPLSVLFPPSEGPEAPIPLPKVLTLISLGLHLNLSLHLHPNEIREGIHRFLPHFPLHTLSFPITYIISAVPPTLCIFLPSRSWPMLAWWCITPLVTFTVQNIQSTIVESNGSISALESMKYTMPGA